MLAEFLTRLREIADEAQTPKLVQADGLPQTETLLAYQGKLERIPRVRPDLLDTMSTLEAFAVRLQDPPCDGQPLAVYVDDLAVVAVVGDGRFDRVRLPLQRTDRWAKLATLENRNFTPLEVVNFLRFELHSCGAEALLAALRVLDFTRTGSGASVVQHGKESLGRAVEDKVQGVTAIPDLIEVTVPVYSTHGFREIQARARVGVYLDVVGQRVRLVPLRDDLQEAHVNAREAVRQAVALRLEDSSDVAVYCGSPS